MNDQPDLFAVSDNYRKRDFTDFAFAGPAGPAYQPQHDQVRLTGQIQRVYQCMKDGQWRTLDEIAVATGDPHASISAQLRHLRKDRFGGHQVDKRRRGNPEAGLYEYRVEVAR